MAMLFFFYFNDIRFGDSVDRSWKTVDVSLRQEADTSAVFLLSAAVQDIYSEKNRYIQTEQEKRMEQ